METKKRCTRDLGEMPVALRTFYTGAVPDLIADLQKSADDLDAFYKAIKDLEVAGISISLGGGIASLVGFGLSFSTFERSLDATIAGTICGGLGVMIQNVASTVHFFKAINARKNVEKKLEEFLTGRKKISKELEPIGPAFPKRKTYGKTIASGVEQFLGSLTGIMTKTMIPIARRFEIGTDVDTSAPVHENLDHPGKILAIYGGVITILFLAIDVCFLHSIVCELNEGNNDSTRVREIVKEIQEKCPTINN